MNTTTLRYRSNLIAKENDRSKWHVLLATWLGIMFDGMDATICVIVLYPALSELLGTTNHGTVGFYGGIVMAFFMTGWALGSVALGVVADKVGRTRAMILAILLYAIATGLCATTQTWLQLAILRFFVGCGIGGEASTGAVLLAETWKGKARFHATGLMVSAFGVGYIVAALLSSALVNYGWRGLFIAGLIPAILTVYIRVRLKDSMHGHGSQSSSSCKTIFADLFDRTNRGSIAVVSLLASTAIVGYWAVMAWIPAWINKLTGTAAVSERTTALLLLNIGGIAAAMLVGVFINALGRRNTFRLAFVASLLAFVTMFFTVKTFGPALLCWCFVVGFVSIIPFPVLYTYAPELFAAKIRGTAVGFSIQIGRLAGAAGALLGGQLIAWFGGSYPLAGSCVALFYLVGIAASFFMKETNGEILEKEAERLPQTFVASLRRPVGGAPLPKHALAYASLQERIPANSNR